MNPKGKGTAYGIDGWRLDVAYSVKHAFWKKWREHVKSINPEAYLTAEIVDKPEKVVPYLRGDEFDGEMNYNFAFACAEFFINKSPHKISASEFDRKLKYLREIYPSGVAYVSQNLFGSHDANRIGSHIVNRGIGNYRDWGEYFGLSQAINNPEYSIRKPTAKEIRIQKLFVIFQMTYVGAPMLYYGDELGMWGGNDPDCRKPMIWDDIAYSPERYLPSGKTRKPDTVEINRNLLDHYKRLIEIRNKHQGLKTGDYKTILADDKRNLFVYERSYKGNIIIVALNNSNRKVYLNLSELSEGKWRDELDSLFKVENFKSTGVPISPKWGRILIKDSETVN
jgi:glycosidase